MASAHENSNEILYKKITRQQIKCSIHYAYWLAYMASAGLIDKRQDERVNNEMEIIEKIYQEETKEFSLIYPDFRYQPEISRKTMEILVHWSTGEKLLYFFDIVDAWSELQKCEVEAAHHTAQPKDFQISTPRSLEFGPTYESLRAIEDDLAFKVELQSMIPSMWTKLNYKEQHECHPKCTKYLKLQQNQEVLHEGNELQEGQKRVKVLAYHDPQNSELTSVIEKFQQIERRSSDLFAWTKEMFEIYRDGLIRIQQTIIPQRPGVVERFKTGYVNIELMVCRLEAWNAKLQQETVQIDEDAESDSLDSPLEEEGSEEFYDCLEG